MINVNRLRSVQVIPLPRVVFGEIAAGGGVFISALCTNYSTIVVVEQQRNSYNIVRT